MAGISTANTEHLIRSNLWSSDIKRNTEAELMGTKFVRMLTDFPDGDTLNIPSIGTMDVFDYAENAQAKYSALDTGNFQFTISKYKQSGTYITEKMKQDSYYMSQLTSAFVTEQTEAIKRVMEADILATIPNGQTAADANSINGVGHRWIGSGTAESMSVVDFAKAKFALRKAFVPMRNLIAIVDPSVEYTLDTQTNIVNVSNNPRWEGIIETGLGSGMRFIRNIYGFDVYVSDYLKQGLAETIGGLTTTVGAANLFFSAVPGPMLPIVGVVRQPPKVDSKYNMDFQREEYVTTCRYDFAHFRPENSVVVITDTNVV